MFLSSSIKSRQRFYEIMSSFTLKEKQDVFDRIVRGVNEIDACTIVLLKKRIDIKRGLKC